MSDEETSWSNKKYIYWLKAAKGLEYLQDGIEEFVEDGTCRHHKDLLKRTGVTNSNGCNNCTIENILPEHPGGICSQANRQFCLCTKNKRNRRLCPAAGICSKMYDCIVFDHCFKSPLWSNTDPRKWCTSSWSIAKAYQTTNGQNTSAKNTDASGLLSIIINDTTFADQLQNPVNPGTDQTKNIYCQARNARNEILHSPKMKIDEATLFEYIDLFSDVLKDIKDLLSQERPSRAYSELEKLKSANIIITHEDEKKIKLQRENALQDIELNKQIALSEIKAATEKAKEEIRMTENANDHERRKQELKEDLIFFNRHQHSTIPVSPLFETSAANLVEFFVIPEMKYVDVYGLLSDISYQRKQKHLQVESLNDIFHTQRGSKINDIYLIADAGLGKTAFCKFLAVCWCHAHDPKQEESIIFDTMTENLETMKEFKYLFFISLRNAADKDTHIDDMIVKQICCGLSRPESYPLEFIQRILTEERNLIVVDGLDEWKSSSPKEKQVPDKIFRQKCTILTTTRTWKFSMLQLGPNGIQKKVFLSGLDGPSAKKLTEKILCNLGSTDTDYNLFRQKIEESCLEDLAKNPLVLMSLICLWAEEKSLRDTKSQIYGSLLDILISRSKKKKELCTELTSTGESVVQQSHLMDFFKDYENCRQYKHYITYLAKLAGETLLSTSQEHSLVFDEQVALCHLTDDCLMFSLAIGVLTKIEVPMKLLRKQPPKYSFLHKTFQEFFAALDICSTETFPRVCDSLEGILDLSNVFEFLSGLSKPIFSRQSQHIKDVVSKDSVIKQYRQEALSSRFVQHNQRLMKKHQDMYIACLKDLHSSEEVDSTIASEHIDFAIEDFIIRDSYSDRSILCLITLLASSISKHTVRSLTFDCRKSLSYISNIMEMPELGQIKSLERFDYWGISNDEDFSKLMSNSENSIKCMTLHFNKTNEEGTHMLLSMSTLSHMASMPNLESLSLWYVRLRHIDLENLLDVISQRSNMSYIGLQDVQCTDGESCQGFSFNLSKHEKLEVLNIGHIPVKEIQITTTSLKECRVVKFPFEGVLNSILECLPVAKKLEIFVCHFLTDAREINEVMQILPYLQKLKMIRFYGMKIDTQESILPSTLIFMELLQLFNVTLSCTAFGEMIKVIKKMPLLVEVELHGCSVMPKDAFKQLLEEIDQSQDFEFLTCNHDDCEYVFRKITSRRSYVLYQRSTQTMEVS